MNQQTNRYGKDRKRQELITIIIIIIIIIIILAVFKMYAVTPVISLISKKSLIYNKILPRLRCNIRDKPGADG